MINKALHWYFVICFVLLCLGSQYLVLVFQEHFGSFHLILVCNVTFCLVTKFG